MNEAARVLLVGVLALAYLLTRERREHLAFVAALCAFSVTDAIRSLVSASLPTEAALYLAWPATVAFLAGMVRPRSARWFVLVVVAHAAFTSWSVSYSDDPEARRVVYAVAHALAGLSFFPLGFSLIRERRAPTETESASLYLAGAELAWIVPVVFLPAEHWAWASGLQSTVLYLLLAGAHVRWIWRARSSSRSSRSPAASGRSPGSSLSRA